MPESFPFPSWGQQPPPGQQSFDDRDLDSLLAGNASDIPDALRPVADTLNALRAAPSAGELHGEADARAQFRALSQGTQAQGTQPQAAVPQGAVPGQGNPISGEIPVLPLQRGGRGRHGRHGSARRPARGRFAGLAAAAAVIAFGAAVTYTGHLPGPMQQLAHDTIAAPPPSLVSSSARPGGVQATSAHPVSPDSTGPATGATPFGTASASPGTQGRAALCDAFWSDLKHPRPGPQPWQTPRYKRLITASGGERNVFYYCYPVWDPQDAPQYSTLPAYPPYFPKHWDSGRHPADQPGDANGQAPAAGSQGNGNQGSGSSGTSGDTATPTASASSVPPPSPQASAASGSQQQQQQSTGN